MAKIWGRRAGIACAAALMATTADIGEAPAQGDIRMFTTGLTVAELPKEGYLNFACGNNGSAPGEPIAGWADFAACPKDQHGLHEVAFQYDDSEVVYEDLEGTAVAGHPIILSLLFTDGGVVEALRAVTDPGEREYHKRRARQLGRIVKFRFGQGGWTCETEPPSGEAQPIGGVYMNDHCRKDLGNRTVELWTNFYRTFGEDGPEMVSATRFEVWRKADSS